MLFLLILTSYDKNPESYKKVTMIETKLQHYQELSITELSYQQYQLQHFKTLQILDKIIAFVNK